MEKTIRVTGKGKISVKPDRIRLLITQKGLCEAYDEALRESVTRKAEMNERLAAVGFEKKDLKTLYFNVDTEYERYQAKDRSWKERLKGYRYNQRMKLEFDADNALLGKVLYAMAHCPGEPQFSIEYTVSDPEAARDALLAKAVADSRRKAEVLTAAAGTQLGELQLIDYSWGEVDIYSRPMDTRMLMDCAEMPIASNAAGYELDIEADDIDVMDTVTVVWTLR